jgi:hypothetical protein
LRVRHIYPVLYRLTELWRTNKSTNIYIKPRRDCIPNWLHDVTPSDVRKTAMEVTDSLTYLLEAHCNGSSPLTNTAALSWWTIEECKSMLTKLRSMRVHHDISEELPSGFRSKQ